MRRLQSFSLLLTLCLAGQATATELRQSQNGPAAGPGLSAAPGPKAAALVEPRLKVKGSGIAAHPRVALTFDACMGQADPRILSVLLSERIPATIFVTARWLRKNPETTAVFLQHPDLFELENHGENHIPAVDVPVAIYGIPAAGSPEAVAREVSGGASAMLAAGIAPPRWFRGSTAKYDASAIRQIRQMGYRIAGYSVNGDGGSLLGAELAERRVAGAKDGDVVLAHINQPNHSAGEGVARALISLKRRGIEFVKLSDAPEIGDNETTR